MAKIKRSSGGSGGGLGHSNMIHYAKTGVVKKLTKRQRRAEAKRVSREALG